MSRCYEAYKQNKQKDTSGRGNTARTNRAMAASDARSKALKRKSRDLALSTWKTKARQPRLLDG